MKQGRNTDNHDEKVKDIPTVWKISARFQYTQFNYSFENIKQYKTIIENFQYQKKNGMVKLNLRKIQQENHQRIDDDALR